MTELNKTNGRSLVPPPAVAPSDLPSAASPDLELLPATPIEVQQICLLNQDEWRGPLSVEEYLDREDALREQDLTRGTLTCWILTSPKLPANADGSRPVLASCESLLKSAYIARNGKVDQILTHGIGSVFTRPQHRGRGYAARMMTELAKQLETWQQPEGVKGAFSILYSDIGQKFYARFGWKVFPSSHVHLDPVNLEEYESTRKRLTDLIKKGLPEIEDLTAADLDQIPAVVNLEQTIQVESAAQPTMPFLAIRPDRAHFAWHHAREEFQSKAIGKPEPTIKGAIHKETGIAVIWCRVYATNPAEWSLHILHVVIPPATKAAPTPADHLALSALLLRAQLEAHIWEMQDGVEVWDPSGFVITAAKKLKVEEDSEVKVIHRDREHLCSLKWNGARPGDDESGKVTWLNNEKYAWC